MTLFKKAIIIHIQNKRIIFFKNLDLWNEKKQARFY